MKILFLHGWNSVVGGVKPTYLPQHGHEVINPALNPDTVILHCKADDVVPFADSEELAKNSEATLIEVGNDHRLPILSRCRRCCGRAGANDDSAADPRRRPLP